MVIGMFCTHVREILVGTFLSWDALFLMTGLFKLHHHLFLVRFMLLKYSYVVDKYVLVLILINRAYYIFYWFC